MISRLLFSILIFVACGPVAAQSFTTIVAERCRSDLWNLNHVAGWQVQWPAQAASVPVATREQRREALERWSALPDVLLQETITLEKGLREGFSAPRAVVERVRSQIANLLEHGEEASPIWSPARRSDDEAFRRAWNVLAREEIIPAIERFAAYLTEEYLPAARDEVGISAVPNGALCYEELVRRWTTLDLSVDELRQIGERHMDTLHAELEALAAAHFETTGEELIRRLRDGPIEGAFDTEDEVADHARDTIERAAKAVPRAFNDVPDVGVEVRRIPRHAAEDAPAGFYQPPSSPNGNGLYLVNTTRPEQRRLMAEAIAFHETIPGHHLQSVLRNGQGAYNAGFSEGWAIYSEVLADDLDLYSTPQDRAGMLVKHMWAASRLMVDPGIHVLGWSRAQAINYMRQHTTLSIEEIEVEVDRYIALPAQSLSYILGYLEIRRLRTLAEAELGTGFDLRAFHDVVLRGGIVTLPRLAEKVKAWIEASS